MNSYQKIGMKCDELEIEVAKLRDENTDLICWINMQLNSSKA